MAGMEQDAHDSHRKCTGTNGRITDLDFFQQIGDAASNLFVLQYGIHDTRINQQRDGLGILFVGLICLQVLDNTLSAHVLHNLLGRIECSLVLVVFQEVLEDMAEHLGVNADFAVLGIILVNCKIILAKEFYQICKQIVAEVNLKLIDSVRFKKSAVQIGDANVFSQYRRGEIIGAFCVEGVKKQQLQNIT